LADAATEEGAAALVRATPNADILVNNLGIYEMKDFAAITDADWRRYFEVNVLSGARLARAYFPGMHERNWGRIIFISSESGLVTPAEMIHYGMTKTAQLAISRGLAGLTKGTKVTVNSVLPGPTRSEGIIDFLKSLASDPAAPPKQIEAEFFAKGRPSSLLQRMIEPDEIANLVAYLASPLSSATNGAALRVDGGVTPTIGLELNARFARCVNQGAPTLAAYIRETLASFRPFSILIMSCFENTLFIVFIFRLCEHCAQ
jgi:NAD(P)-dependent dehydrogenase (short-subunit alcohol dehydrogenase family)